MGSLIGRGLSSVADLFRSKHSGEAKAEKSLDSYKKEGYWVENFLANFLNHKEWVPIVEIPPSDDVRGCTLAAPAKDLKTALRQLVYAAENGKGICEYYDQPNIVQHLDFAETHSKLPKDLSSPSGTIDQLLTAYVNGKPRALDLGGGYKLTSVEIVQEDPNDFFLTNGTRGREVSLTVQKPNGKGGREEIKVPCAAVYLASLDASNLKDPQLNSQDLFSGYLASKMLSTKLSKVPSDITLISPNPKVSTSIACLGAVKETDNKNQLNKINGFFESTTNRFHKNCGDDGNTKHLVHDTLKEVMNPRSQMAWDLAKILGPEKPGLVEDPNRKALSTIGWPSPLTALSEVTTNAYKPSSVLDKSSAKDTNGVAAEPGLLRNASQKALPEGFPPRPPLALRANFPAQHLESTTEEEEKSPTPATINASINALQNEINNGKEALDQVPFVDSDMARNLPAPPQNFDEDSERSQPSDVPENPAPADNASALLDLDFGNKDATESSDGSVRESSERAENGAQAGPSSTNTIVQADPPNNPQEASLSSSAAKGEQQMTEKTVEDAAKISGFATADLQHESALKHFLGLRFDFKNQKSQSNLTRQKIIDWKITETQITTLLENLNKRLPQVKDAPLNATNQYVKSLPRQVALWSPEYTTNKSALSYILNAARRSTEAVTDSLDYQLHNVILITDSRIVHAVKVFVGGEYKWVRTDADPKNSVTNPIFDSLTKLIETVRPNKIIADAEKLKPFLNNQPS